MGRYSGPAFDKFNDFIDNGNLFSYPCFYQTALQETDYETREACSDRDGTALHTALLNGHDTIVKQLLENGADINAASLMDNTALYKASLNGHEAVVKRLLESGADTNVQGKYYNNALQAALARGWKTIVELLLEKGADRYQ